MLVFVLLLLAIVWAAVLVPPVLQARRDGRPGSSVVSFRATLSTLERAVPGSRFHETHSGRVQAVAPGSYPIRGLTRSEAKRRRRDVLVGLMAATGFTFLLAVAVQGLFILVFLLTAGALGAYVYALRQLHLRHLERTAKVRPLVRRPAPAAPLSSGAPVLALRRSAN
jgi:hypothetical protein